jgi:methylated-DNA-protein-cysteine methyltransferase-like protein
MSDFYEKVYALVRKIPKGRAMSYGDIAEYLGTKGSARTVGYAMNHAHTISPAVPAHRVVNRNGSAHRQTSFWFANHDATVIRK